MAISIETAALANFFVAVLMLLFSSHFFGYLLGRFSIPRVVGEIFGGLVLGPTLLGHFFPQTYAAIFLDQGLLLAGLYWIGLVLLMFISGFELAPGVESKDRRTIAALVLGTTTIPLLCGWALTSFFDLGAWMGPAQNELALKLVVTVALAVTSIPVISKIFLDLGVIQTRFAKIVLATATIHDIILWVFVSVATGLVAAQALSLAGIASYVLVTVLFFMAALLLMPRIFKLVSERKPHLIPDSYESAFMVLILLLFTAVAGGLQVNLVFGALLAGVVVNSIQSRRFEDAKRHVKEFSMAFFVPIYFGVVGLKLDLLRHLDPVSVLTFIAFAMAVQTAAVLLTTRLLRYDWRSGFNLAMALNNRGGPCIVLATLALDVGIISGAFFTALVLLAIFTSMTAGLWLKYVLERKWPLLQGEQADG